MGEGARVVEVEGVVAGLLREVLLRPGRASAEPLRGPDVAERLPGEGQLGGTPFHVVPPRRLGIERVWQRRDDVRLRHVRDLGLREDRGGRLQLLPRPYRVAGGIGGIDLGSERQGGGHPAGKVRWDGRARIARPERGTMAQVAVGRVRQRVIGLRQAPQVVVARERPVRVPRTDADLDVEAPAGGVPGLLEPVLAEACLVAERRGRVGAELAHRRVHQADAVGGRMGELDEIAGIEPAAGEIHGAIEPLERLPDDRVAVGVLVLRPRVDVERAVVEVRRLSIQVAGDDVGTVPLSLEEGHGVGHARPEEFSARSDLEGRGGDLDRAAHRDPVGPRIVHRRHVEPMDRRVRVVPVAAVGSDRAGQHDRARVVDDREGSTLRRGRGQQVGDLGLVGEVAELVDADDALDRRLDARRHRARRQGGTGYRCGCRGRRRCGRTTRRCGGAGRRAEGRHRRHDRDRDHGDDHDDDDASESVTHGPSTSTYHRASWWISASAQTTRWISGSAGTAPRTQP